MQCRLFFPLFDVFLTQRFCKLYLHIICLLFLQVFLAVKKQTIFSCLFEPLKCLITSGYASQSNRLEKWICVAFILENIESSCYSFRKKKRERNLSTQLVNWAMSVIFFVFNISLCVFLCKINLWSFWIGGLSQRY